MSEFNPHDDTAGAEPIPSQSSCCSRKDPSTSASAQGTCTRSQEPTECTSKTAEAPTPPEGTPSATCLCGGVKVWFSSHIIKSFICHCLACRKETSSMFATALLVPDQDFTITYPSSPTSDLIRAYNNTADSGNTMTGHFCGNCGSTMYRTSSGFPGVLLIPQGVVDSPELRDRKLDVEQWTCRRVEYLGGLPWTEKFAKGWNPAGEGREE